jgi:hypothetical protein
VDGQPEAPLFAQVAEGPELAHVGAEQRGRAGGVRDGPQPRPRAAGGQAADQLGRTRPVGSFASPLLDLPRVGQRALPVVVVVVVVNVVVVIVAVAVVVVVDCCRCCGCWCAIVRVGVTCRCCYFDVSLIEWH